MFAILSDRTHRSGIVMGFLSQKQHFGTIEAWLHPLHSAVHIWAAGDNIRLDPGMEITTDWAYLSFIHPEEAHPLDDYLKAVAREHHLPPQTRQPPTGWCSWYQYFNHITAEDLSRNLHLASACRTEIPLKIFQLDDGYQAQVGDWLETAPHFSEDLGLLAKEITKSGLTPGLWLAPFILHRKSRVAKEHPDWLLRNPWGIPVSPGYVFDTFPTALDVTHPAALEYVQEVAHTAVHKWGFPYLKLDFLYAAALPGSPRDPSKTRAQMLRQGLEAIRQAAGDEAFLLACGCPLGSAIGLVDAMRIGPDVSERWQPYDSRVPQFIFKRDPGAPAVANALRNTLSRAALHNRWWINDPDCLLLRPDTLLSPAELQSWVTAVFLSGGSMILSDNLERLTPDRKRLVQSLLPPLGLTPQIIDLLDSPLPRRVRLDLENQSGKWHLLAYFNWEDTDQDIQIHVEDYHLPEIEYLARDYWRQHTSRISAGHLTLNAVPAHGVALLALRPFQPDQPQYIGSNLHLSQGWEVSQWKPSTKGLTFRLQRLGHSTGHFELYLPRPVRKALCNGSPLSWENKGRIYRFAISFFQTANLQIIT
jgi:alpha-galactosidase